MPMTASKVRVNMNLPEEDFSAGKALAEARQVSFTEAVRGAIATEKFLREAKAEGKKILIQDKDGNVQEIVFR